MKIKPTGNKLLLKKIEEQFSAGGLALPTGFIQSAATVAEVLDTGPGYEINNEENKWSPCLIEKGQVVLFNAQAGMKIDREITKTTELILLREDQIFAILEDYDPAKKVTG